MEKPEPQHLAFSQFFAKDKLLGHYPMSLLQRLDQGHICLPVPPEDKERLAESDFVTQQEDEKQPFVLWKDKLYLERYFQYETQLVRAIEAFLESEQSELENRKAGLLAIRDTVENLFGPFKRLDGVEVDWQKVGALNSVLRNFSIITGGPGTGKTTTVAKLLALLYVMYPDLKVALSAPTGKASQRMNESLQGAKEKLPVDDQVKQRFEEITPSTIHRLLGSKKDSIYFRHNAENQLPYDVIIVDESSMVDLPMMAKLVQAVNKKSRLILLGDKDQLASVEAGSVFGDLCLTQKETDNQFGPATLDFLNGFISESAQQLDTKKYGLKAEKAHLLAEHVVELKLSYRFSGGDGIGTFSRAVIAGEQPTEVGLNEKGEGVVVSEDYEDKFYGELVKGYSAFLKEPDVAKALVKMNQVRVLCAMRKGAFGVEEYNRKIERFLRERSLLYPTQDFYHNQPIMVTSNDYTLGLFNGDVGLVRKDAQGNLKAYFEDNSANEDGQKKVKAVSPYLIKSWETTFAMTIHKSQGSEFSDVVVVLPDAEEVNILTCELLYTGVTRAKKRALVLGKKSVLLKAIEQKVERASGIEGRLAGDANS